MPMLCSNGSGIKAHKQYNAVEQAICKRGRDYEASSAHSLCLPNTTADRIQPAKPYTSTLLAPFLPAFGCIPSSATCCGVDMSTV